MKDRNLMDEKAKSPDPDDLTREEPAPPPNEPSPRPEPIEQPPAPKAVGQPDQFPGYSGGNGTENG